MTIRQNIPDIGGGSLSGVIFVVIILAALTPFFAFRVLRHVIGERTMYSLLFSGGTASALSSGMGKVDS
jgi:hypothetical protein